MAASPGHSRRRLRRAGARRGSDAILGTRERSLLLDELRPPRGYGLDRAVGTTYTLDLSALLTAPLAFTFFNYQDEAGEPTRDPVALLEALRRHAEKVTLFCQAGGMTVPRPELTLLAYLEGSVVQVQAPRQGGVFHPKLWLIRFTAEGLPTIYRVLCLSRNLTFDRSWDTCLAMEGELPEGGPATGASEPLVDLLRALPGMAARPVASSLREDVERMADDLGRVRFEAPEPFRDLTFHAFGVGAPGPWPFPAADRAMAVAPFLTAGVVERLQREQGLSILVSLPESLDEVHQAIRPETATFVLSPSAEMDAQDAGDEDETGDAPAGPGSELAGLHAKLFLLERGGAAHLFVGSANATSAAFDRNVELLVELVGDRQPCGIDTFLGQEEDDRQAGRHDGLRSLLQSYGPKTPEEVDLLENQLEREADALAREMGVAELEAHVEAQDGEELFDLELRGVLPPMPEGTTVSVWPATLSSELRKEAAGGKPVLVRFGSSSFDALTAFWAFEIDLQREGRAARRRFVVSVPLVGVPENRRERLLRSMLRNRRQVLRLLLLLLSSEGQDVTEFLQEEDDGGPERGRWGLAMAGGDGPALLESLLQSLVGNPRRVDQAARLIEDLRKTPEGRELLPPELDRVWGPVWQARERGRR